MPNININNYELYAIDYIENNLDTKKRKEFELFLEKNPKIKNEIKNLAKVYLPEEKIHLDSKFELKKSPVEGLNYFEYLAISDIEKTINTNEKKELIKILSSNEEKLSEYQSFKKTILNKDEIIYPFKKELKKSKIIFYQKKFKFIETFAAILLIFFVFTLFIKINLSHRMLDNINSLAYSAISSEYEIDNIRTFDNSNNKTKKHRKNTIKSWKYVKKYCKEDTEKNLENHKLLKNPEQIKLAKLNTNLPEQKNLYLHKNNKRFSLGSTLKKLNPITAINLALKGFDILTESNKELKIDYQKNKKTFVLESKSRSYKISW